MGAIGVFSTGMESGRIREKRGSDNKSKSRIDRKVILKSEKLKEEKEKI